MAFEATQQKIKIKEERFAIKRLFDIFFSSAVIIFGFPVFLLLAIIIFFLSPGQIFYRHERVGRNGRVIKCLKFRTMCHGADQKLKKLLNKDPILKLEWEQYFKLKNDPRVIPFGKWLRKSSLDELPQFFNVLKGDLSVVGPRPCVKEEVDKYFLSKKSKILSVRPGITGLWQVSGRNDLSWEERLKIEEQYVDKRSFILDLIIIVKTVKIIFSHKGAY